MNTKITICHVITRMDWGGSPDLVRLLCISLPADQFEVTLVIGATRHPSRKTEEFFSAFNARVVRIPRLMRDISLLNDIAAFFQLYAFFRSRRFDIVHTHTAKAGFLGRITAFLCGCRCIVHTPHGHNFYGYFNKMMSRVVIYLERLASLVTRKIVVLTELERKDNLRFKICPKGKLTLILTALEEEFLNPPLRGKDEMKQLLGIHDAHVVGMIGRLEPVKGPEYFVEGCRMAAGVLADTRFVVVGEGSLRSTLESQVARCGLTQQFLFTGWREDIPDLLSCMDVLVLPSLNEAVGLVLLQAQAAGVPVVASRVGGIPEAVREGATAVLVPPADSAAIAAAVKTLITDPSHAGAMGKAAREWVRNRFTVEAMIREHTRLYIELAGQKNYTANGKT